jgi:hypothetical protein
VTPLRHSTAVGECIRGVDGAGVAARSDEARRGAAAADAVAGSGDVASERLRGLSWQLDRVEYRPGMCADIFAEQIRLGYLRIRVPEAPFMSADELAAALRRQPGRLLPDSYRRTG